jgi:hypothetical protein
MLSQNFYDFLNQPQKPECDEDQHRDDVNHSYTWAQGDR